MIQFDIILACDENGGIGKDNKLPWHLKEDLQYFKRVTTYTDTFCKKNVVIMGRKTWDSISCSGLSDRINIVISRTKRESNPANNLYFVESFHEALQLANSLNHIFNVFVVGGAQIYNEAFEHPLLRNIFVTKILRSYECDTFIDLNNLYNSKLTLIGANIITSYDSNIQIDVICEHFKYTNNEKGELQYLELLNLTYTTGEERGTRNSTTISNFGGQIKFNLQHGFPLLTTKKTFFRGVFEEVKHLILLGNTDTNVLSKLGVRIWEGNTSRDFLDKNNLNYEVGDIGPMYGFQLRHYNAEYNGMNADYTDKGTDQFRNCIELIKNDPNNRRILMTTYNPTQANQGVLYPCHGIVIQFYVKGDTVCCHMFQRSVDLICGLPFNIASYALMLHIVVETLNAELYKNKYTVGELIMSFGDVHVYNQPDHLVAVKEQTSRIPFKFPTLNIKKFTTLEDFEFTHLELENYVSHPPIKVQMVA